MYKRKRQIGYNKKNKKPIYEELTYEYFSNHLDDEYYFRYKELTIDIAFHYKNSKKIYELNINGYDEDATHYSFDSAHELLLNGKVEGKTIIEIWEELEN